NGKPLAILLFRVEEQQLLITDLSHLDPSFLPTEIDVADTAKRNLFYSFVFETVFDRVHDYHAADLSKENLLAFFRSERPYYLFLKNPDLLIREQRLNLGLQHSNTRFFDCPIALINTTSENGLATSLASVLEKSS